MYYRSHFSGFRGRRLLPPAVKGLLIANGVIFILQELGGSHSFWRSFGLTPSAFWVGAFWQPLTYMFLHGGFTHLLFNMLALWMFGTVLESLWGTKGFLSYYFLTGIGAGLSNCLLTPNADIVIIGASGAVYGLLAAYGLLFPNTVIYFSFLFPIRAKYLVLLFGLFEFIASIRMVSGDHGMVAHIVHLGGMVIGVVYIKRFDLLRWGAHKIKNYQRQQHEQAQYKYEHEEHLRQDIDEILDRINEVGIGNLTPNEKRRLHQASEKLKRKR